MHKPTVMDVKVTRLAVTDGVICVMSLSHVTNRDESLYNVHV